jgi:FhuF 2Fe-2S C-terminal domain
MDDISIPTGEPSAPFDRAELLLRTADLGEHFALREPAEGDWQELPHLFRPATVIDFVDRTRAAIAASSGCDISSIPVRLAASSFQLGIAARLLSPAIGAATCFSAVPVLTTESVKWKATAHHSPQFGMTELEWISAETAALAAGVISASVVTAILGPLNETLKSATALSLRVTWGNVISAANGAVTVLAMSRPELESRGRAVVRALMDTEQLVKTGRFVRGKFVRRSCCLFYLAPESGLCTDCVLAVSDRSQQTDLR